MKTSDYPAHHRATIDALIAAQREAAAASVAITHDFTESWVANREEPPWSLAKSLGHLATMVQSLSDVHYVLESCVEIGTMHALDQAYSDTMDEFRKAGRR